MREMYNNLNTYDNFFFLVQRSFHLFFETHVLHVLCISMWSSSYIKD